MNSNYRKENVCLDIREEFSGGKSCLTIEGTILEGRTLTFIFSFR